MHQVMSWFYHLGVNEVTEIRIAMIFFQKAQQNQRKN